MKTLALLSLLITAPALAQTTVTARPEPRAPFTLSIDTQRQWHRDQSYRLFGTRRSDLDQGLSATVEVGRVGRGLLDVGAGVQWSDATATWGGGNEAKRDQITPLLSAALRWPVHRWFQPHLRVAGDLTRAHLRLTTNEGGVFEDRLWSPGGSVGAGFRLTTGTLSTALRGGGLGFAAALVFEGGMHVGAPLSFDVARPTPADKKVAADQIPAASVPVGDLGRTEPYLRISLALSI
jgi:hypothetical protein